MSLQNFQPKKILLRSPNWVGDAVMATPVPRALKLAYPEAGIHILAKPWAAPVWEQHPDVDRIILLEAPAGRLLPGLRQEHYDLAIVLPNSFSSAWLAWRARAKRRVGYATEGRSLLLNARVPWRREYERLPRPQIYLKLAEAAGAGPAEPPWPFCLRVTAAELARADELLGSKAAGRRIGLAPGSVAASRRWPPDRYARLADRLSQAGHGVVLLGSRDDAAVAGEVAALARCRPLILAGRTSLREALAVIRRLDLVVSNDSGTMHLAYAQDVPVLVLQGAADARSTGPFGSSSRALRAEGLACAPCVRNECERQDLACMLALGVDQVWAAVQALWAGAPDKRRRP